MTSSWLCYRVRLCAMSGGPAQVFGNCPKFNALSQLAVEIQANAKQGVVKPGLEFFYAGLMA